MPDEVLLELGSSHYRLRQVSFTRTQLPLSKTPPITTLGIFFIQEFWKATINNPAKLLISRIINSMHVWWYEN